MSSIARWSYTSLATIWQVTGRDEFSQPTYGTPYTIDCSWIEGGKLSVDDDGTEFVPSSEFYFEAERGSSLIPVKGSWVMIGDQTGEAAPPTGAEKIRAVDGWDAAMFGDAEIPDWVIKT